MFCALNSRSPRAVASSATASNSAGDVWPAVANAHAVLASSCALNSRSPRAVASSAIASNSAGDAWPAVANAHAVMEMFCALNSRSKLTDPSASPFQSAVVAGRLRTPSFANAHAVRAKCTGRRIRPRLRCSSWHGSSSKPFRAGFALSLCAALAKPVHHSTSCPAPKLSPRLSRARSKS